MQGENLRKFPLRVVQTFQLLSRSGLQDTCVFFAEVENSQSSQDVFALGTFDVVRSFWALYVWRDPSTFHPRSWPLYIWVLNSNSA